MQTITFAQVHILNYFQFEQLALVVFLIKTQGRYIRYMATRTSFSCGTSLDITSVHELQKRLAKSLSKASTIELKADQVEKADTAGLQLLLSVSRQVALQGGALVWKKPTKKLIDSANLLGLANELGLD